MQLVSTNGVWLNLLLNAHTCSHTHTCTIFNVQNKHTMAYELILQWKIDKLQPTSGNCFFILPPGYQSFWTASRTVTSTIDNLSVLLNCHAKFSCKKFLPVQIFLNIWTAIEVFIPPFLHTLSLRTRCEFSVVR